MDSTEIMVSIWKSFLSDLPDLESEQKAEYKKSIEACISNLQSERAKLEQASKAASKKVSHYEAIEKTKLACRKSYSQYWTQSFVIRATEFDLLATARVVDALQSADPEYPEISTSLSPQLLPEADYSASQQPTSFHSSEMDIDIPPQSLQAPQDV